MRSLGVAVCYLAALFLGSSFCAAWQPPEIGDGAESEDPTAQEAVSDRFAIICFPGPPASDNRLQHYRAIKRANFNLVLPSYQYSDEDQLKMLEHCRTAGLHGVVNVKRLAPPAAEGPPPANWPALVRSAADRFAHHPSLYGYMIRDEPSVRAFPQLGRVADEFRRVDPAHHVCVNLFPIYASADQLGVADYARYLDQFLTTVKPPALCYDHYPFLRDGTNRTDFFENLEVARRACLKHDTPLWIVVLSGWWQHFRTPSEAELRWQAFGALAYGIRGIAYFTYWPANDDYAAIVDDSGAPQPLYEAIRRLNGELHVLGTHMADMRSVGVYHLGEQLPTGCQRLPAESWLGAERNAPLAIGLFEDSTRRRFALVMNRNVDGDEDVTLTFPATVRAVSRVDSSSGQFRRLNLQGNTCRLVLPAGSGCLIAIN